MTSIPPVRAIASTSTTSSAPFQNNNSNATPQPPLAQPTALRYPSNRKTIYDRNLNRSRTAELSRAAFAYLFIEMIGYAQKRVKGIADLEKR